MISFVRGIGRRLVATFTVVVAALTVMVGDSAAQTASVAGAVVDAKSGRPLPDATVRVEGTDLASRSGTRGEFRINGVAGGTLRLRVNRIGYQAMTLQANSGDLAVRITMAELVVKLDELVVTGTAGDQAKRTRLPGDDARAGGVQQPPRRAVSRSDSDGPDR